MNNINNSIESSLCLIDPGSYLNKKDADAFIKILLWIDFCC